MPFLAHCVIPKLFFFYDHLRLNSIKNCRPHFTLNRHGSHFTRQLQWVSALPRSAPSFSRLHVCHVLRRRLRRVAAVAAVAATDLGEARKLGKRFQKPIGTRDVFFFPNKNHELLPLPTQLPKQRNKHILPSFPDAKPK